MRLAKRYDLVLAVFWGLAALEVAVAPHVPRFVHALVGLPVALVLPGYTTMSAVFPRRRVDSDLRGSSVRKTLDFVGMVLGVDLAELIVLGLLLNALPIGLDHNTWLVSLSLVTLAGAGIGAARHHQPPALPALMGRIHYRSLLLASLACLSLLAGSLAVAIGSAQKQQDPTVQHLWILPNQSGGLDVGVSSGAKKARYSLTIFDDETVMARWPDLRLSEEAPWETTIAVPPTSSRGSLIRAVLHPLSGSPGTNLSVSYQLPAPQRTTK